MERIVTIFVMKASTILFEKWTLDKNVKKSYRNIAVIAFTVRFPLKKRAMTKTSMANTRSIQKDLITSNIITSGFPSTNIRLNRM